MKESYYITTPIYYVTDAPHIGHLYTTVATDAMARYQRAMGKEVWFLTGTDEHGQKIQKKAKEIGEKPEVLADRVVVRYREAWKRYDISFDDFIRTTEDRHKKVVVEFMKRLMATGDIYLGSYEGWYCLPCESYWTENQLENGSCPMCQRSVEKLKEESYFFKMSAYADRLMKHIDERPDFILPDSRKNEVVSFIRQGLRDISISRTSIEWGIPMPVDSKASKAHKVYVWFDALTNYISALGYLDSDPRFEQFWPMAIHVVGKDILRFHAVYWPTFLMALNLPLPKQIVAHGWLTDAQRQKISKSVGNVVDPMQLADEIGVEGMRYFLLREFVFGMDGEYTKETLYHRVNSDLANNFGNCVSRVCSMILKYLGPEIHEETIKMDSLLATQVTFGIKQYHEAWQTFSFHRSLESVGNLISLINRDIDTSKPWELAKGGETEKTLLKSKLLEWREALRVVCLLMLPVTPVATRKALYFLGDDFSLQQDAPLKVLRWGGGSKKGTLRKPEPIFPRLERKA